jgi:hypothetical protein
MQHFRSVQEGAVTKVIRKPGYGSQSVTSLEGGALLQKGQHNPFSVFVRRVFFNAPGLHAAAVCAERANPIVIEVIGVHIKRIVSQAGSIFCVLLFCAARVYAGTAVDTRGEEIQVPDHDFRVVSLSP